MTRQRMAGYARVSQVGARGRLSDDPEWSCLSDEFHSIARDPGALSLGLGLGSGKERKLEDEARAELTKRELAKREDYLFDNVYQAVVRQALQVLLMDGSRTFQLPGLYTFDTHRMADALRSAWAAKLRLTGPDTIWTGARLVFTEENWRQWLESRGTLRAKAVSEGAAANTSPKPKLSQTDKEIKFRDYIAQQPPGRINKSQAEKELMNAGLPRKYIREQFEDKVPAS